jgi:hypothetical protein
MLAHPRPEQVFPSLLRLEYYSVENRHGNVAGELYVHFSLAGDIVSGGKQQPEMASTLCARVLTSEESGRATDTIKSQRFSCHQGRRIEASDQVARGGCLSIFASKQETELHIFEWG